MNDYYSWNECKQLLLTECRIKDNNDGTFTADCSSSIIYKGKKKLKASIEFYTSFLPTASPAERWFYILHNIKKHLNPICLHCGKPIIHFNKLAIGYRTYCSVSCQNNSKERKEKLKKNSLLKWGVENPAQSKEVRNKYKATCLEKYGVENISQVKEIKEKKIETSLKHYGVEYPMRCESVSNQARQTWSNKTDEEYADRLAKTKQTLLERYGDENYHNIEQMNETKRNTIEENGLSVAENWSLKMRQTRLDRYGDENYKNEEKTKQTLLERYGDENYRNIEKSRQTCFDKTGYWHPSQNPESGSSKGFTKCQNYNENLNYRGTYELDFINTWLEFYPVDTIKNAEFIRYKHNDREHIYFPDFEITYPNGKKSIVEIKGTHPFFYNSLEDGTLLAKWNATEEFIRNNPEYIDYFFILNGELADKDSIFLKDYTNKYKQEISK